MKKIVISIITVISLAILNGCKDYLDLVPEKDVTTIESIFKLRATAEKFYRSCFSAVVNQLAVGSFAKNPAFVAGGEVVACEFARQESDDHNLIGPLGIADGYQNSTMPYCNMWTMAGASTSNPGSVYACIRYCNIFIQNIDKVYDMFEDEKNRWKAEIICTKAFYYFELMKRYGPIVLVDDNLDTSLPIEEMQLPRSHVDTCFNRIVSMFESAIPYLETRDRMQDQRKPFFNKEAAYAYIAIVRLYAASPLFNGNGQYADFKNKNGEQLFSTKYDHEKWKLAAEAADEALRQANIAGIELRNNSSSQVYPLQNKIQDISYSTFDDSYKNGEWIFMQNAGVAGVINLRCLFPKYAPNHSFGKGPSKGIIAANMQTVEMFYTNNGVPIDEDKTWHYSRRYEMGREASPDYTDVVDLNNEVLNLHLRREPRFYANIAAQGTYWSFSNKPYLIVPYKNGDTGTIFDRFNERDKPQNITGYWVKKFTIPSFSPLGSAMSTYMCVRKAELYLIQAEAWNEYLDSPDSRVYNAIDVIRERAGILPVRDAWSKFSNFPGKVETKEGMREIIRRERMIEFAFEGHHYWDLRRWKTPERLAEPHRGWNVMGEDSRTFFNDFNGPSIVSKKPRFSSPRDYFMPIKSEEIMISNVKQNIGW